MAGRARSGARAGKTRIGISVALALLAPLIVFAAVLMVQNGLVSLSVGLDLIALRIALWASFAVLAFALWSLMLSARRSRRQGLVSLAVVLICAAISAAFVWQARALSVAGPLDVSTDLADPPVVAGAAGTPDGCDGVIAIPSQAAVETVSWVLLREGFTITEPQLFSVRAVRRGFWFGLEHEAVIRIRPDRTDVRVVARYDRRDGGATCRLAAAVVDAFQVER